MYQFFLNMLNEVSLVLFCTFYSEPIKHPVNLKLEGQALNHFACTKTKVKPIHSKIGLWWLLRNWEKSGLTGNKTNDFFCCSFYINCSMLNWYWTKRRKIFSQMLLVCAVQIFSSLNAASEQFFFLTRWMRSFYVAKINFDKFLVVKSISEIESNKNFAIKTIPIR